MIKKYFIYCILYPVHLTTWIGIILYHFYFDFSWVNILYFVIGWILIYGIGVHVTLHRYVSHSSFVPTIFAKPIILWLACLSLQGSPIWWAALHRGSHHKYTDTLKDVHTPIKGKWYAWHSWLHDWPQYFNTKYVIDLIKDPTQVWISKNYSKILLVTYIIISLISWKLLLFGFMLPAIIGLYQENTGNVLLHCGKLGYRNFDINDNSRNVPFIAVLTWGQGYHNNHHAESKSYDFGSTISGNSKEFDPALLLLPFVATVESRKSIYKARTDKINNKLT
jgi:stearoyl-CoA desaturase (delta-9 desaturase)